MLDDAIVCQVLTHIIQYLTEKEKLAICEYIPGSTVQNLFEVVREMNKETARHLLCQVSSKLYPVGKLQEAIAIYKCGIEFDGVGFRRQKVNTATARSETSRASPLSALQSVAEEPLVNEQSTNPAGAGHTEQSNCTPYLIDSWHNYTIPKNKSVAAVHHEHSPTCTTTASDHGVSCCRRIKCKKEKDALRKKIDLLNQRIERLSLEVHTVTEQKNKAEEELQLIKKKDSAQSQTRCRLSIEEIRESDELVLLHTGLQSVQVFDWLFNEVKDSSMHLQYWNGQMQEEMHISDKKRRGRERSLKKEEELVISLMKLKLNMNEQYTAFLFSVSESTISRVISTWIPFLSKELQGLIHWPLTEELHLCYPDCFKKWENVTTIIDCFEIPTEKPSHVEANSQIFSSYKNRPTVKFLLACTPGVISLLHFSSSRRKYV